MEKKMETTGVMGIAGIMWIIWITKGLYRDYRVYIGVILATIMGCRMQGLFSSYCPNPIAIMQYAFIKALM